MIEERNLRYYLSGGQENADPNQSLGGPISDTEIGEGLNNLFADVTGDQAAVGHTAFRCVYFRNVDTDLVGLFNPVLWIDEQSEYRDIMIGLPYGVQKNMPAAPIARETESPIGVRFLTSRTKDDGLLLPGSPLKTGDYVAIWVRRATLAGAVATRLDRACIRVEGDTF